MKNNFNVLIFIMIIYLLTPYRVFGGNRLKTIEDTFSEDTFSSRRTSMKTIQQSCNIKRIVKGEPSQLFLSYSKYAEDMEVLRQRSRQAIIKEWRLRQKIEEKKLLEWKRKRAQERMEKKKRMEELEREWKERSEKIKKRSFYQSFNVKSNEVSSVND